MNVKPYFKNRDWKFDIVTWLSLMGVGGAIVGIFVFPVSILKFGFTWWNITGAVGSFVACCLPMIFDAIESKKNEME